MGRVCPILNENCGCDFTESAWRKKYMEGVAWNEIFSDADAETSDELEELRKERQEINKAKVLLRDERNELNRRLREQARVEDQVSKNTSPLRITEQITERHPSAI